MECDIGNSLNCTQHHYNHSFTYKNFNFAIQSTRSQWWEGFNVLFYTKIYWNNYKIHITTLWIFPHWDWCQKIGGSSQSPSCSAQCLYSLFLLRTTHLDWEMLLFVNPCIKIKSFRKLRILTIYLFKTFVIFSSDFIPQNSDISFHDFSFSWTSLEYSMHRTLIP